MPLNRDALTLDSSPRSVQDARHWVGELCRELGRGDLAESAELGVSELVTNAILHGSPPLSVRLRGTRHHPRVEVFDGSHRPPEPNPRMTEDDELLSTIGRGLGIVAMCSDAWGADIHPRGKVVWFEPATSITAAPKIEGEIFDYGRVRPRDADDELGDGLDIRLTALPVPLYADFLRHYHELRRELRILSLAHERDYPVAKSITDLFVRFDRELAVARGVDQLEAAIETGVEQLDAKLTVSQASPRTMNHMIEVLELADSFCRAERLLSLATTRQQLDFQRWFLGEFVGQARGGTAQPWTGETQVDRPKQRTS